MPSRWPRPASAASIVHSRSCPKAGSQATQRGYNLLNARFSYDFLDDRAQVALWAKNLLDQAYFNNVTPIVSTVGFLTRNFAAPRTFGAELSWRF